jgi:hypothetical protein
VPVQKGKLMVKWDPTGEMAVHCDGMIRMCNGLCYNVKNLKFERYAVKEKIGDHAE